MSIERKKDRERKKFIEIAFDELFGRLIRDQTGDSRAALEEVRKSDEEVKHYVEERQESIRKGARRSPKRFRI